MSGKFFLSQGALLLGSLLFFLPFTVISCQGMKVAQLTGVQLATGTQIQIPGALGGSSFQVVPPQTSVAFALGLGVLAFLAGFGYRTFAARVVTLLAGLGAGIALLGLQIAGNSRGDAMNPFTVETQPAYWGALLCFVVGGLLSFGAPATQAAAAVPAPVETSPPVYAGPVCWACGSAAATGKPFCAQCGAPASPPSVAPAVCGSCGAAREANESFCGDCGARFETAAVN